MKPLPSQFRDKVVLGDVLDTLRSLPSDSVHMVYGDPDYGVGVNYNGKKYTQRWKEYMDWYGELAKESMRVLRPDGNLFLINYPRQNAHLRVKHLEDVAHNVFEYAWVYPTNVGHTPRRFTTAHRSVLHAVKSSRNRFFKDQVAQPYKNPTDRRIRGRLAGGSRGRMPYSWFEFNLVKNVSRDKTLHACQIPAKLFKLLLNASTQEGDDVFILFGGSGSEIVMTKCMGRTFLSCEIHPLYHEMIKKRLKNGGDISEEHKSKTARNASRKPARRTEELLPPAAYVMAPPDKQE